MLRLVLVLAACCNTAMAGYLDDKVEAFKASDLRFQRAFTNVPFLPIGLADISRYGDAKISRPDDSDALEYNLTKISQAAVMPFLASQRDAVMVGEWITWSDFNSLSADVDSFNVLSVGLPVAWLRQASDDWQLAAFFMPLGSKASLPRSTWSWDYLGGAFGRYSQNDNLWWAFGGFFDITPGKDIYLPYIGASWAINQKWTLNAIMPWPAILYAPTQNTFFRLGASPSGTSWSFQPGEQNLAFNLDTWDFGISIEQRLHNSLWVRLGAGIGGLRGLRLDGGDVETPEFDADSSPFISLGITFRPTLIQ